MNNFLWIFKKSSFSIFTNIFEKKSITQTNIIVYVLFYVNMLDQVKYSLNSIFFTVILSRLVSTSGFHCGIVKVI